MTNKAIETLQNICKLSEEGRLTRDDFYDFIDAVREDEDSQRFDEVIEVIHNKLELSDKDLLFWANNNWLYFQFLVSTIRQ